MQYLMMIYSNEAAIQSATKEQTGQIMAAYAAYTEAMKKRALTLAAIGCSPHRPRPRCAHPMARAAFSTGRTPKPRSSLAVITSSKRLIWTPRWPGPRAARARRTVRSRSAPSGPRCDRPACRERTPSGPARPPKLPGPQCNCPSPDRETHRPAALMKNGRIRGRSGAASEC